MHKTKVTIIGDKIIEHWESWVELSVYPHLTANKCGLTWKKGQKIFYVPLCGQRFERSGWTSMRTQIFFTHEITKYRRKKMNIRNLRKEKTDAERKRLMELVNRNSD